MGELNRGVVSYTVTDPSMSSISKYLDTIFMLTTSFFSFEGNSQLNTYCMRLMPSSLTEAAKLENGSGLAFFFFFFFFESSVSLSKC